MQLVAEIEDAFNIMIDTQDVIDMSSYEVTKTILAKYGVAFD
jgi:acyl carrier protein